MKYYKNIDGSFRILIPPDIRNKLNLKPQEILEIELNESTNKIILTPTKNTSEPNLEAPNTISKETTSTELNKDISNHKKDSESLKRILDILDNKSNTTLSKSNAYISPEDTKVVTTNNSKVEEDKLSWINGVLVHSKEKIIETKPKEEKQPDTTELENKYIHNKLPKFKNTDKISFRTPHTIIKNLDCSRCSEEIDINSYVMINGKFLCNNCTKDLIEQLKTDSRI
jgi:AbrB family looped-hinge helix DNA binding protein